MPMMVNSMKFLLLTFLLHLIMLLSTQTTQTKSKLFREYIGAEGKNVSFTDVLISSNVEFHFILSFAIDYTLSSLSHTNGHFNVFWDTDNLSPSQVLSIKSKHSNVRVAVNLGGDSVSSGYAYFQPSSIDSWVCNAVVSLTRIIKHYNLDGIDIDYEHVHSDDNTFFECIGRLITILKQKRVIKFASIAPYDDDPVQTHYQALWKKYSHAIDYVNFQFYAYDKGTTVSQFLEYFETQSNNHKGGTVLVSFGTDESGGLKLQNGFFAACRKLKSSGQLHGIFVWSADDSKNSGFLHEKQSQSLLASPNYTAIHYCPVDCLEEKFHNTILIVKLPKLSCNNIKFM